MIQEKRDTELREHLAHLLVANNTIDISDALVRAPSLAVQRHITRLLASAHVDAGRARGDASLLATVFAMPVVIVAGNPTPVNIPGALPNISSIVALMKEHGALRGNQTFALSNALAASSAFALEKLPASLDWWAPLPDRADSPVRVERAAMAVPANQESVFLRFIVGTALAGPGVDLMTENDTGKWGMPFTQTFAKQLGGGTLSLLALPFVIGSSNLGLIAFVVFYGLDWVATVPPTVAITAQAFAMALAVSVVPSSGSSAMSSA